MKKLILGMFFVLLTALFIAFNYLLWDKESRENEFKRLENVNASNVASINAHKREIDSLVEENSKLSDEIERLENEREQLLQDKLTLAEERDKSGQSVQEKVSFINVLKQYVSLEDLSEPVRKWADALNQGKYDEAYAHEYAAVAEENRTVSPAGYAEEMKDTIRKVEISEVKLDKLRGSGNGDIILEVRLNIKLADDTGKVSQRYSEGVNDKYIKIQYDYSTKAFIIAAISNV